MQDICASCANEYPVLSLIALSSAARPPDGTELYHRFSAGTYWVAITLSHTARCPGLAAWYDTSI